MEIKLHSTKITVYAYKRNKESTYFTIVDPIISQNGFIYTFRYKDNSGNDINMTAIAIGNRFYLHNDESFAVEEKNTVDFFLYGHAIMIEDLHCDDEVKLCLKLKYSELMPKEINNFYTYKK